MDIRGLSPDERRETVPQSYQELPPEDTFYVVSDRDPTPVQGYLREVVDDPERAPDTVEVKRQNPETWLLRAR